MHLPNPVGTARWYLLMTLLTVFSSHSGWLHILTVMQWFTQCRCAIILCGRWWEPRTVIPPFPGSSTYSSSLWWIPLFNLITVNSLLCFISVSITSPLSSLHKLPFPFTALGELLSHYRTSPWLQNLSSSPLLNYSHYTTSLFLSPITEPYRETPASFHVSLPPIMMVVSFLVPTTHS